MFERKVPYYMHPFYLFKEKQKPNSLDIFHVYHSMMNRRLQVVAEDIACCTGIHRAWEYPVNRRGVCKISKFVYKPGEYKKE